jgi:hypothetical protein
MQVHHPWPVSDLVKNPVAMPVEVSGSCVGLWVSHRVLTYGTAQVPETDAVFEGIFADLKQNLPVSEVSPSL